MTSNTLKFIDKFREVKNLEIIESQSDIKRLSKDFYSYSPILTEKLDECIADLVVRPSDHEAVKKVAEICWEIFYTTYFEGFQVQVIMDKLSHCLKEL